MREDERRKEMKRQKENRRMKSVGLQESQKREEPQPSEERIELHKKSLHHITGNFCQVSFFAPKASTFKLLLKSLLFALLLNVRK